jgi:ABC-2 type transport system ATP-binding protein
MIRLTNLTKRYGAFTAVDGIDLEVPAGEMFGFIGPNGAGKTTTLRMIAGILKPTGGTVEIGGINLEARPREAKMRMGFIPDRPYVYDKLTGAEFMRFVAALFGQEGPVIEKRIDELLEIFDLGAWKDELTESYSHGMRQKLIISSALVHRPEVIVVDEPMVGSTRERGCSKDLFREFVDRGARCPRAPTPLKWPSRCAIASVSFRAAASRLAEPWTNSIHHAAGDASSKISSSASPAAMDRGAGRCLRGLRFSRCRCPRPASARSCRPWRSAVARLRHERSGTPPSCCSSTRGCGLLERGVRDRVPGPGT